MMARFSHLFLILLALWSLVFAGSTHAQIAEVIERVQSNPLILLADRIRASVTNKLSSFLVGFVWRRKKPLYLPMKSGLPRSN